MDYPDGFHKHLQPPVDAAIHKAEVDFIEARDSAGYNFFEHDAILDWIDTIFWPFSEQACEAGIEELWTGQEIRNALEEYLNRLASYAQLEKSGSGPSDSRIEFYIKHIKESSKWLALQRKLAGIASARVRKAVAPHVDESGGHTTNRELIEQFIDAVLVASGKTISKTDVWRVAGYSDATQFERFQREKNVSSGSSVKFKRILRLSPAEFLDRLSKLK
jgi:hypothetical protein